MRDREGGGRSVECLGDGGGMAGPPPPPCQRLSVSGVVAEGGGGGGGGGGRRLLRFNLTCVPACGGSINVGPFCLGWGLVFAFFPLI